MSAADNACAAPVVVDLGCWVCRVLADAVKAQAVDVALYEGMIAGARIGLGAPPILCPSHAERWKRIGMDAGLAETFRTANERRAAQAESQAGEWERCFYCAGRGTPYPGGPECNVCKGRCRVWKATAAPTPSAASFIQYREDSLEVAWVRRLHWLRDTCGVDIVRLLAPATDSSGVTIERALAARIHASLSEAYGALANRRPMKPSDLDLVERDVKTLAELLKGSEAGK